LHLQLLDLGGVFEGASGQGYDTNDETGCAKIVGCLDMLIFLLFLIAFEEGMRWRIEVVEALAANFRAAKSNPALFLVFVAIRVYC
jgi:hypothetical protein